MSSSVDHYENFPVASWLCPKPIRPAVRAIYHWARTGDDIADEGSAAPAERLADLASMRLALSQALKADTPDTPDTHWCKYLVNQTLSVCQKRLFS